MKSREKVTKASKLLTEIVTKGLCTDAMGLVMYTAMQTFAEWVLDGNMADCQAVDEFLGVYAALATKADVKQFKKKFRDN